MINRVLRTLLLWAARNPWLGERLPALPFMQKAVRRFMPGEFYMPYPLEVEVGGATVFVLPVERFERL